MHLNGCPQNTRQQQASVRMWGNWNHKPLLVAMSNGAAILENSLMVPQDARDGVTIGFCNPICRYIPKRNENICLHKNLSMNVPNSIIHNSQKMETLQVSVS